MMLRTLLRWLWMLPLASGDDVDSSFRPFKANNTEAYAFPDWVGSQIAPRDAIMTDATCREQVVAAAKTAQQQGFAWNSVDILEESCAQRLGWPP